MVMKNGNAPNAIDVVQSIGRFSSFDANRILKSNTSVFINSQYSGADDFTDSNGVMNTVDTSASTAVYDIDNEQYTLGFTDEASGDTTHDPDSVTSPANAFDTNDSTFANKTTNTSTSLGKTFAQKFVSIINFKADALAADNGGSASGNMIIRIETFNGSTWDTIKTFTQAYTWGGGGGSASFSKQEDVFIDALVEGVRVRIEVTGGANNGNQKWYTIGYGDYDSTSTVETDTILSPGVPKSIVVYGERTEPTNTSITIDVSDDGGATFPVTGGSFDSYIDTTSLSGSNLALRFNLNTTDTEVTPLIKGYGVSITDS